MQEKLDVFKEKQLKLEGKSDQGDMFEPLPKWKIANLGFYSLRRDCLRERPIT